MLTVAVTAWCVSAAVLLIAGLWLLLAGRLNARHRSGERVRGIVLAARVALVAATWPVVLVGCMIGGVRARLRDSTRRLVAAGHSAAVVTDVQSHRQRERTTVAMNSDPRGQVDYGVPQTAPFWVGQRIQHTHAGRGVVISVQAKDPADPRGSMPGGRWCEVVVEFDRPYVSRPKAGRVRPVRHLDLECSRRPVRAVPAHQSTEGGVTDMRPVKDFASQQISRVSGRPVVSPSAGPAQTRSEDSA